MTAAAALTRTADQQDNAAQAVNIFSDARERREAAERYLAGRAKEPPPARMAGIAERLERLAPLHRSAALRRAMRETGAAWTEPPDLTTLAAAEHPPAARWRVVAIPPPTVETIEAQARALVGSLRWRASLPMMLAPGDQLARARRIVAAEAWERWAREPTRRELANSQEHEAGQALAARWRPVLDALRAMLDDAEARIPDLYLAAAPEGHLREMATLKAGMARARQADADDEDLTPTQRRERCPKHQMRAMRRRAAKARQDAAALFGTVGRDAGLYSDDYSLARWRERQEAGRAWAAQRVVVIDVGGKRVTVPLSEVMEGAAKAGLAQLYAMHLGLDEHARAKGMAAVFITLTLPPEYHPSPTQGRARWNPKLMPGEADRALMRLWARVRARLAKRGIRPFGLRVVEPHKDGCPHLHALLYVAPGDVELVDAVLMAVRPEPVPGQRRATTLKILDTAKGSAPTYALKYILKSRNSSAEAARAAGQEGEDGDHLAAHDRVRAWASERGLRRFGWVGLHGVNAIWRAIHARREMPAVAPAEFHEAHAALHERRYRDALGAMGALRDGRPRMRLAYEEETNSYGETVRRARGVRLEGQPEDAPVLALRKHAARVASRAELADERAEQEAMDRARKRAERAAAEVQEGGVTVIVSFPRGPHDAGAEGEAGGRTGPPEPEAHDADYIEPSCFQC